MELKMLKGHFRRCYDCGQPYQAQLAKGCPFCNSVVWDNLRLFKLNGDGTVTIE